MEWLTYFEKNEGPAPKTQLMSLPDLLKTVRKPNSAGGSSFGRDMAIKISESELEWLIKIHKQVRNQFVHFEPKSWSLEVSGIPEVSRLICRIINDIFQVGWGFRHLKNEKRAQFGEHLHELPKMDWGSVH